MKVLILGANGMAGSMMTKYLSSYYDVTPWTRKDFDAQFDVIPDLSEYDYVINCIGIIKQKADKFNDKAMFIVNAEFPHQLANKHSKVIHISSDCVFSGKLAEGLSYKVTDAPDAEDSYGKSKAQGEPTNAMVLRTSIIGPSKDNAGLFEWFRHTTDKVNGFTNHWWSGITTLELAKIVQNIIDNNLYKHGLNQIAGNSINKYELLQLIDFYFDLKKPVNPHKDKQSINRILEPTIQARHIVKQFSDLRKLEHALKPLDL